MEEEILSVQPSSVSLESKKKSSGTNTPTNDSPAASPAPASTAKNRPKIKRDRVPNPIRPRRDDITLPAEKIASSSSRPLQDAPRETRSKKNGKRKQKTDNGRISSEVERDVIVIDDSDEPTVSKDLGIGADFVVFDDSDSDDSDEKKTGSMDRKEKERDDGITPPSDERDTRRENKEPDRRGRRDDTNDDRREKKSKRRDHSPCVREWDRNKERRRSRERETYTDRRRREKAKYGRRDRKVDKVPWLENLDLDSCTNVAEVLHREVKAFTKWISPTPVEDEIRGLVVAHIKKVVAASFRDAKVLPFGSYATKLYLPTGDIDLVILSDSMAYSNKVTVLHSLAATLKRAGITDRVSIIAKARVPIVKFVTKLGMFHVDISINQGNGLVGVDIINGFLRNMHGQDCMALRGLVLITKMFLAQRGMNEVYTGGLGSYAIVCLVVSFLQMHPKIRRGEMAVDANMGVLVMEFFELYGCYFNFDDVGISVRDGGTYYNKRQRGWHNDSKGLLLSIEDPADPSNDISSGSFAFNKVKTTFAGAFNILASAAYLKAGIINSRRSGGALHLRGSFDPADLSVLSAILSITQETINHRKVVQEVYDSGDLHRMVGQKPLPQVFDGRSDGNQNGSGFSKESYEMNMDLGTDSEQERESKKRRRDDDESDGGRYNIGKEPPKKRRRKGISADFREHFTTGEDSVAEGKNEEPPKNRGRKETQLDTREPFTTDEDSLAEEEDEYASDSSSPADKESKRKVDIGERNRKQSYWLSKGIGPGDVGDSDN
ncbi:uncharacterized protein BT62DRAFT_947383 [Guyanagaster necrorhizus]|uniref:polynucleotide adenylyltransferase n=1 Tax=Guyanagaster necrorhizus TaxID=856835 RepID=A0A9P7VXD1_9AGAR|nr:uncharacterized protein BT62DRAFT_947383 [Guyanagaster necrorhizus MCA 3950]KAG7448343.1 hypothetical protein BT62DRAFT_947383 [Guyanagaster necrorhizus MCA 3950]